MTTERYNELIAMARRLEEVLKEETQDYVPHADIVWKPEYLLLIALARYLEYK